MGAAWRRRAAAVAAVLSGRRQPPPQLGADPVRFSRLCARLTTFITVADAATSAAFSVMPVPAECGGGGGRRSSSSSAGSACESSASLVPPGPINTRQPGVATSPLYSGSRYQGYQKSKGSSYDVEVVLQVINGVCCDLRVWNFGC